MKTSTITVLEFLDAFRTAILSFSVSISWVAISWEKADEIRKQLDERGIILDDTPEGTIWKKK